jgi:phosphopantetheinyl transferase (holo-ACP synthase)
MYVGTADLRYLARYNVNRGLDGLPAALFKVPRVPYRELSSAPVALVGQERAAGLGELHGFLTTRKKWRKRNAAMMRDVAILEWWGYEFTRDDEKFIREMNFRAMKERAKKSGLSRTMTGFVLPAALTIMTAGAATPLALAMAAGSAAVGYVATEKARDKALSYAGKSFAIKEEIIATEFEIQDIQKDIAEIQRKSGIPKPVINKVIQDAANKQQQEKKALSVLLMGGGAAAVAAMAA